jgi:DNA-binding transcriptional regulator/RsmH inhibitor MraZ
MRSIIKAAVRVIVLIMFIKLLEMVIHNVQWTVELSRLNIEPNLFYYFGITLGLFVIGTLVLYLLWRKTDWMTSDVNNGHETSHAATRPA